MPSSDETGLPIAKVRDALEARIQSTSLRRTAREVGMSPTGLQKLLDGTDPYTGTVRKLERWYVREKARGDESVDGATAYAAVRVLFHDLPPAAREAAMRSLVDSLEDGYRDAGRPLPGWISELRRRIGAG